MKPRETAFQSLPYPPSQVLACSILEAIDVVQVIMIELLTQRLERVGDLRVVYEPAGFWINLSAHGYFTQERMPVQPRALVVGGHARQPVSRFKRELFHKLHDHAAQS